MKNNTSFSTKSAQVLGALIIAFSIAGVPHLAEAGVMKLHEKKDLPPRVIETGPQAAELPFQPSINSAVVPSYAPSAVTVRTEGVGAGATLQPHTPPAVTSPSVTTRAVEPATSNNGLYGHVIGSNVEVVVNPSVTTQTNANGMPVVSGDAPSTTGAVDGVPITKGMANDGISESKPLPVVNAEPVNENVGGFALVGATGVGEASAMAAAPAAAPTPAARQPATSRNRGVGQLAAGAAFNFQQGGTGGPGSPVVCVYNCDGQAFGRGGDRPQMETMTNSAH